MPRHCQCGCNRTVRNLADRFATRACKAKDIHARYGDRKRDRLEQQARRIADIFRSVGISRFVVDGIDVADPACSATS